MITFSIRTLAQNIKYNVEFNLPTTTDPVRLLDLDSRQLLRLIVLGYAVDDNVFKMKEKYGNVFGIPEKNKLSKEEKLSLKNK